VGRSDEEERETKPARDRFALKNTTRERASEMMNTRGDRGDASGAREVMSPCVLVRLCTGGEALDGSDR
jgi:hypothetical protein